MIRPLRALPRPDSTSLDAAARAAAAVSSLRVRPVGLRQLRRSVTVGAMLIVVDDIVTTGATLAAVSGRLKAEDVQVTGAAVLAATQLRRGGPAESTNLVTGGTHWANRPESVPRTRGDGRASAR